MPSIDPKYIDEIARARLLGSEASHNPEWPPYQMYPWIYDAVGNNPSDSPFLMQNDKPPPGNRVFGTFAQADGPGPYTGQRTNPDMPSARDVQLMQRSGDPIVRKMFEDAFGTEALDRENRNRYGVREKSYVPTPRSRPTEAPTASPEDYLGEMPQQMEPFQTEGPNYQEAPTQDIQTRARDYLAGPGPSRDLKRNREDGSFFDRAFSGFPLGDNPPVQDMRLLAIEDMMRKGANASSDLSELPQQGPKYEEPPIPEDQGPPVEGMGPMASSQDEGMLETIQRWMEQKGVIKPRK
jgi:hypothetical protein